MKKTIYVVLDSKSKTIIDFSTDIVKLQAVLACNFEDYYISYSVNNRFSNEVLCSKNYEDFYPLFQSIFNS